MYRSGSFSRLREEREENGGEGGSDGEEEVEEEEGEGEERLLVYHGDWLEMFDNSSDSPYYVNQSTGDSVWQLPVSTIDSDG